MRRVDLRVALAIVLCAVLLRCGDPPAIEEATREGVPAVETTEPRNVLSSLDELPPGLAELMQPWHGDLDAMAERDIVRLLTVFDPMTFYLDGPKQRGIAYETAVEFEKVLNKRLGRRQLKVNVIIVPVGRDQLIPALVEGRGDIAVANLTITPERLEHVDFSLPMLRDVRELVVSGPAAPAIGSLEDLSDLELGLRRTSSYWESMELLNEGLVRAGRKPARLLDVGGLIQDHDLLEMVDRGMLAATIVDSHRAEFFDRVFDQIHVRTDLAVRTDGEIAWAFRKNSPQLREAVDAFVRKHRKGTKFGNIIYKRYLEQAEPTSNCLAQSARLQLQDKAVLFRRYAEQYSLDWLLVAAQAYQESRHDQSKRSRRGAIGVMQLLPRTAREIGISDVYDLEQNIHGGVKYLRYIMDKYLDDEGLDPVQRSLLALAAYNAGPSRIKKLRRKTAAAGLDPNVWFGNVEVLVAREVGSETVRYVSNIVKYYVAYRMIAEQIALDASSS